MSKSSDQIVIGANGTVYVAPVGTTEPADISAAWPAGWVDLGFTSEDGVKFKDAKTVESIPVWQLFYPARRVISERDFSVEFALRQFSGSQVEFAFGGGTVSEDDPGKYRYTPPNPETIDDLALGIEWLDGENTFRLIIPRGLVSEDVESQLARATAVDLPITFSIIGEAEVDPWYLLSDLEGFVEAT